MSDMHVIVRSDLCVCTGNCARIAPDVFSLVGDQIEVINAYPGEALRDQMEEAEASCPADAIEVLRES